MSYKPSELDEILRLRRGMILHSYIYYVKDDHLISDVEFDRRAIRLVELQTKYPETLSDGSYLSREFKDFTGDTGYHLPYQRADLIGGSERLYQSLRRYINEHNNVHVC